MENRTIKFRVFDKQFKFMSEVDDMDLFINNNGIYERHCVDYQGDHYENADEKYILMQYTGLKDKNGVEIYEGDILDNENDRGCYAIKWNDLSAGWTLGDDGLNMKRFQVHEYWEVIGNIHQNPELLGE